jgi:hypothetical protein
MISTLTSPIPGTLATAFSTMLGNSCAEGKVGLYRIEVGVSAGTSKLKPAGGLESRMKESAQRAFAFSQGHKVPMGIASVFDTTDFHVEAIDLLGNQIACEAGIALIVAVYSAIKKTPSISGLIVLGDLSIQGNIKAVQSLVEPLRMAMENGARRALIPLDNKRSFLEVSGEIMEKVDPIFFSDPQAAAAKALAWPALVGTESSRALTSALLLRVAEGEPPGQATDLIHGVEMRGRLVVRLAAGEERGPTGFIVCRGQRNHGSRVVSTGVLQHNQVTVRAEKLPIGNANDPRG